MGHKLKCTKCGNVIDSCDLFCKYCGFQNTLSKTDNAAIEYDHCCPNCGKLYVEGDSYCIYCGICLNIPYDSNDEDRYCPFCGKRVLNSDTFCIYCGSSLAENALNSYRFAVKNKALSGNRDKRKHSSLKPLFAVLSLVVFIGGILGYRYLLKPYMLYIKAAQLLEKSEYKDAYALYNDLENYRDSKEKALLAKYSYAVSLLQANSYEEAIIVFDELSDYSDSEIKLKEAKYNYAEEFFRKGEYKKAKEIFDDVPEYKDSITMSKECLYQEGLVLLNNNDFDNSNEIFTLLGDYKDSANLIHVHSYTETIITKASCTNDGYASYTCELCGDYYEETIKSKGHQWLSATCTKPQTCSVCGTTSGEALGHTTTTGICERCGFNFTPAKTVSGSFDSQYYTDSGLYAAEYKYSCDLPIGSYKVTVTLSTEESAKVIVYIMNGNSMNGTAPYWYSPVTKDGAGSNSGNITIGKRATDIIIKYSGRGSFTVTIKPIN